MDNSNNISRYIFSFFFSEEKRKQSFRDSWKHLMLYKIQ